MSSNTYGPPAALMPLSYLPSASAKSTITNLHNAYIEEMLYLSMTYYSSFFKLYNSDSPHCTAHITFSSVSILCSQHVDVLWRLVFANIAHKPIGPILLRALFSNHKRISLHRISHSLLESKQNTHIKTCISINIR